MSAHNVDFLKAAVLPELLRYAVQRHIFCECGSVLDISSAKLIEIDDKPGAIACPSCFFETVDRYADLDLDTRAQALGPVQVLDGIDLTGKGAAVGYNAAMEQLGLDFGGGSK